MKKICSQQKFVQCLTGWNAKGTIINKENIIIVRNPAPKIISKQNPQWWSMKMECTLFKIVITSTNIQLFWRWIYHKMYNDMMKMWPAKIITYISYEINCIINFINGPLQLIEFIVNDWLLTFKHKYHICTTRANSQFDVNWHTKFVHSAPICMKQLYTSKLTFKHYQKIICKKK